MCDDSAMSIRSSAKWATGQQNFQVFYAAPPEKINSIGQHIDNTVSLYTQGKYTKPVEGSWYSR